MLDSTSTTRTRLALHWTTEAGRPVARWRATPPLTSRAATETEAARAAGALAQREAPAAVGAGRESVA